MIDLKFGQYPEKYINNKNVSGNFSFRKTFSLGAVSARQERIKGQRKHPPYTPCSIGNSSRVIFRIRLRLARSLRGCFVEVSHD